jgi:hypothetical protein
MNIEIASSDNEILANWEDANAFCASLGTGWRLPTKSELNSIYLSDEKRANAIYWSASSSGGIAWVQNLGSGKQYCNNVENVNYVRPVRDLKDNKPTWKSILVMGCFLLCLVLYTNSHTADVWVRLVPQIFAIRYCFWVSSLPNTNTKR